MKNRLMTALLAAVCLTLAVSAQGTEIVVSTVPDAQGLQVGAKAALVMEAYSGKVLFEQNGDDRLPMASTTKIMTALLALEQPGLDDVFEVDGEAIRVEGSSMGLREGDKATLRALATGMLLSSGNDAAGAAAVRIAGSAPAFADLMNQRAAQIGMENTHFVTPSGLDDEEHYSSAYDMALLAREALRNPEFAAICSQYKMRTTYGNPPYQRWLTNHNKLLNYYEGTVGVKTGFTKKSGRCLVSAATRNGVTLICVTLNCGDDWTVHQNLYDRFFPQWELADISGEMPRVEVPVTGGTLASVAAVNGESLQVPVPAGGAEAEYRVTREPFLYAPVEAGQLVGQVEVYLEGELVHALPLTAERAVPLLHEYREKRSLWKWLTDSVRGLTRR